MLFFNKTAAGGAEWIIVFLGNPGARFENTRHNAGFMTADVLAGRLGVKIDRLKHKSLTARAMIDGKKIVLMKPQTFMNLSGDAVLEAMRFYKTPTERILVVSDEIALPLGKLRVRRSGSAGGHNGLKDIIAKCGGEGFPRLRIGVGQPSPETDTADWVLSSFTEPEREIMKKTALLAAECVECAVAEGAEAAMSKYN